MECIRHELRRLGCFVLIEADAGLLQPLADLLRGQRLLRPFEQVPDAGIVGVDERCLLARVHGRRKLTRVERPLCRVQVAVELFGAPPREPLPVGAGRRELALGRGRWTLLSISEA